MILQALLVTRDDPTAETLIQVLARLNVGVDRSNVAEVAASRLAEERFDQVIVDFDDPEAGSLVLESCRRLTGPDGKPPITVVLLNDASKIRSILGSGAHFILTKPVTQEQAHNTLRAATAMLQRERRQSLRVAVQAGVSICTDDADNVEGILLDLSTGGMDVLVAKPLPFGAKVHTTFQLPDGGTSIEGLAEVAWTSANGQIGLRFFDMDARMREELCTWLAAHSHNALPEESDVVCQCKLTDLSLGGCYVETQSPFPQSSAVDLCLHAEGLEIHAEGLVRVMHPGHGMGVEFPARTEEQRKNVADFIEFLTGQPGATPQLEISPRALVANAVDLSPAKKDDDENGAEDPLLELLRAGNVLDEEEFLADLHRQRTPADVSQ